MAPAACVPTDGGGCVPSFLFDSTAWPAPGDAFWAWRGAFAALFDVALPSPEAVAGFAARAEGFHLGHLLAARLQGPQTIARRSGSTIARGGIHHFLVQCVVRGACRIETPEVQIQVQAGEAVVLDLSRPLLQRAEPGESLLLVVPRGLLLEQHAGFDAVHGAVLQGTRARLLARAVSALLEEAPAMDREEGYAMAAPTLSLLAALFGPAIDAAGHGVREGRLVKLVLLRQYLDTRLADPALETAEVCDRFGLSRSSLYRLMEPYGGFARYLNDSRLRRCFYDLVSAGAATRRVSDVAQRWGFQNEAAFSRAFRRMFGVSPRDVRQSGGLAAAAAPGSAPSGFDAWVDSCRSL